MTLPPWVVLNVPHEATLVPASVRDQFVVSDQKLAAEIERWTDHQAADLFVPAGGSARCARAPVSRLVVDVDRFVGDDQEPASRHGFGVVYTKTSTGIALRRLLHANERASLLFDYDVPHHRTLEALVDAALQEHGRCLMMTATASLKRRCLTRHRRPAGGRTSASAPMARVAAVMVEVHRRLYLEGTGTDRRADFAAVAQAVQRCCASAVRAFATSERARTSAIESPEPSFLVLGLDRAAACELGRRWEQNAIVWAGTDAIPELIQLR